MQRGARSAHSEGPWLFGLVCVCVALAVGGSGCTSGPLKGGHALTGGPLAQSVSQGENASQPTRQSQETVRVRTYTLPAGSRVEEAMGGMGQMGRDGNGNSTSPRPRAKVQSAECRVRNEQESTSVIRGARSADSEGAWSRGTGEMGTAIVLSAPTPVIEREETRANTELGAAQKDTAREIGAKLESLRGIVWVGVGLFILGIASFAWPPLRVIIGSVTTSVAMTLGGIALMVLPSLIVGNELWILGAVGLAVGGWFLAHRHGHVRGQLHALTGKRATSSRRGN